MTLVSIGTTSQTGYCDCVCGCYELASLRDEDACKGYFPGCAKNRQDWNAGIGIPCPAPTKVVANVAHLEQVPELPPGSAPPAACAKPALNLQTKRSPVASVYPEKAANFSTQRFDQK